MPNWSTGVGATTASGLEGAAAPTAEARVRANASNVLQIVHESVNISYTKIAARGQLHADVLVQGTNPVDNEFDWQVTQALKQCARDINYAFINGAYAEPADNATARQTRGLIEAISTNAIALVNEVRGGTVTVEADDDIYDDEVDLDRPAGGCHTALRPLGNCGM